jgi:hypothetical protein
MKSRAEKTARHKSYVKNKTKDMIPRPEIDKKQSVTSSVLQVHIPQWQAAQTLHFLSKTNEQLIFGKTMQ